uniref:Uncharacterized protein n=1 Tax=Anguilla anguilla TaxID=7936 RepID=A0A0E9W1C9_ANGAN
MTHQSQYCGDVQETR